jgi:hypothetical protein
MCNQQPLHSKPLTTIVKMAAMIVMMFGLAIQTGAAELDKSWTTGGYTKYQGSQTARIARLTNISSFEASSSEKGSPSPTVQTLFRLCNAMKTSPAAVVARLERHLARPSPSRQTKAPATKRS